MSVDAAIGEAVERVVERVLKERMPSGPGVDPFVSYGRKEAAQRMGVSADRIDELRKDKLLPCRKVGREFRFLEEDIQTCWARLRAR